jgi:hypothetical protein
MPGRQPSFDSTTYSSFDLYLDQQRMASDLEQIHKALKNPLYTGGNENLLGRINELDGECIALEECTDHFTHMYDELLEVAEVVKHHCWPGFLLRERRLIDHVEHELHNMQENLKNLRVYLQREMGQMK